MDFTTDARCNRSGDTKPDATLDDMKREAYEERAGILEFDAGYTRKQAESLAWKMVYGKGK